VEIYRRMFDLFRQKGSETRIRRLCIGLGYTAVVLDDDSIGIAYTWIGNKTSCALFEDPEDYEGKQAVLLLEKLFGEDLLGRSVAIATVNALNHANCTAFPTDHDTLLDDLDIVEGSRVSMIGYFGPLIEKLGQRNARLNVYDLGKDVGTLERFYADLPDYGDALILSSTSVIHGSTEQLLSHIEQGTPCVLLGPTTTMLPEAFSHLPITILGGTCPLDIDRVLMAIRHARGTRAIQKASRKVYWKKP